MFGSPETTSGGNALKFYSSVRIDVRRKEKITEKVPGKDDVVTGFKTKVKIVKNKCAPPYRWVDVEAPSVPPFLAGCCSMMGCRVNRRGFAICHASSSLIKQCSQNLSWLAIGMPVDVHVPSLY